MHKSNRTIKFKFKYEMDYLIIRFKMGAILNDSKFSKLKIIKLVFMLIKLYEDCLLLLILLTG